MPDLLAHRRDEAHRRVVGAGEHEAEAELVDRARDPVGRLLEVDAELLEHVGRARGRARRAVAVLRHRRARRSGHERRRRRDVERVRAVAAGADDVDHGRALRRHRHHVLAHRLGEAGDLVGRLALRAQGDEEAGDLGRRRLAVHDRAHQLVRVGAREVMPVEQQLDRGADDHRRKFLAIAGPERCQHALRVELHALDRQLPVAHAHHLAVRRVRRDRELRRHGERCERVVAPDLDLGRGGLRRRRGRRARSCSTCRAGAPSPGRRCRRTPRRSPGARDRRRASASSGRARGSARSRRRRSRGDRDRGRRRAGRTLPLVPRRP